MNLTKIFETQAALDAHINAKHPVQDGENRLSKKILALMVELAECANEWRKFKFWSTDQEPRDYCMQCHYSGTPHTCKNPLLEEYVDCLHFIVSIGLELEVNHEELFIPIFPEPNGIDLFISVMYEVAELDLKRTETLYKYTFSRFMDLGAFLGFTTEQIEEAYYSKNEINHERQESNY